MRFDSATLPKLKPIYKYFRWRDTQHLKGDHLREKSIGYYWRFWDCNLISCMGCIRTISILNALFLLTWNLKGHVHAVYQLDRLSIVTDGQIIQGNSETCQHWTGWRHSLDHQRQSIGSSPPRRWWGNLDREISLITDGPYSYCSHTEACLLGGFRRPDSVLKLKRYVSLIHPSKEHCSCVTEETILCH